MITWLKIATGLLVLGVVMAISRAAEIGGEEPIAPIAAPAGRDTAKIDLGRKLFEDPRLSGKNAATCTSCHPLDGSGADGLTHATGADGRPLDFNTPTIFNVSLDARLNWRGNFRDIESQNEAALLDARIMGTNWEELLTKLRADADYRDAFAVAYGGAPDRTRVLDALASFQRSLVTPDAPFDRFLRGDHGAMTTGAKRGYELFKTYGCVACHQGVNIGGNLFQRLGIFHDPFAGRPVTKADLGRFTITGKNGDRHVFRVPSLRNVALTAPYLHDGSATTLAEVVAIMGRSQLGRTLPSEDIDAIVQFLNSLTGSYQGRSLAAGGPSLR